MKNFIYSILLIFCFSGCYNSVKQTISIGHEPEIWPDYSGVTIPYEIAPMNFNFVGCAYNYLKLIVKGSVSGSLETSGKNIEMDVESWHTLVKQNKGGYLEFFLSVVVNGVQSDYQPFKMFVSNDGLEEYGLTYRKIAPGYVSYGKMGLYCRNLSDFQEDVIIENTLVYGTCVNCHTANKTNPDNFVFHVRGQEYGGTVINRNGNHKIYDTKTEQTIGAAVYPYWHKSGRYIAFSTNLTFQVFHTVNPKRIEVFDRKSDLQIYDVDNNQFVISQEIKNDTLLETFPVFSTHGDELYYCAARRLLPPYYLEDIKYTIMKVKFDENTGNTGNKIDTLIFHDGKSATFPRPSYDGKYLMYTVADYGTFPIWHNEADLYLYNFADSTSRPITEVNSEFSDSFHNWSENSKWFVFTSRRIDGLFTHLYISHIDENGVCSKPFVIPQKNPLDYYNNLFLSYNTPDFTKKKVDISKNILRSEITSTEREKIEVR